MTASRRGKAPTLSGLMRRAGGPLTVAKARSLTAPLVPKKKVKPRIGKATQADVGVARRELAARYRAELDQELRHYEATYALLAARGVAGASKRAASLPPLRILAEGDSWFKYPLHGGGVIPRLEDAIGLPILNLAKAGDEVRYMLGVDERKALEKTLTKAKQKGEPFDALLFSGGGNDIVGNPMCLWVKPWNPQLPPAAHLDLVRFGKILGVVQSGYEDLFATLDLISPGTRVFLHGYDFAPPTGKGVCFCGPWLKPALDYRGFPGLKEGLELVTEMLLQFNALMTQLATRPNVTLIPTQGTLTARQWANELHPTPAGFDAIAAVFRVELQRGFPGRIA